MKYLTALIVFLFLMLFDVILLVSCAALVGIFVIAMMRDYPTSRAFAERIWK